MTTPMMARVMPIIGAQGISGQISINTTPSAVLVIIRTRPTTIKKSLEKKPTHLETKRSVKAWNFNSKEASRLVAPAEICRYGWNKVRSSDEIEKKSAMLAKLSLILCAKVAQPVVNHQENNSKITIYIYIIAKNKTLRALFLATIFKTWMFALVAVFVIIVPILFCNRFKRKFSCHGWIITCLYQK